MSSDLDSLLDFARFTHEVRNIERAILLESDERKENDSEHGYQMALVAMYLIDKHKLKLDPFHCVGMALVHDIVEVYAGDTVPFAPKHVLDSQEEREKKATLRIKKQWPNFASLNELLKEYEEQETEESKFVYALDKFLPAVNNYLYEGRVWRKMGLDLNWVKKAKANKTEVSPVINKYYLELINALEKQPELFKREV